MLDTLRSEDQLRGGQMEHVMRIVPLLFVVAGLAVLVWGIRERLWWSGFQGRAVPVQGEVTDVRMRSQSIGGSVRFSFRTKVAFVLPDGSPLETWARYPIGAPAPPGTSLDLLVDPHRPQRVVVAGGPGAPRVGPFLVGAVLIVAGLGFFRVFSSMFSRVPF